MNAADKVEQLKQIIINNLSQLIDSDYYLLEVPYYTNIGDSLIWQGELDFLSSFPYKCKGMYSLETFPFWKKIPDNSLVFFQGGGNFGDIWTKHHDFKINIIRKFPKCRFVFFPQTVWFNDESNLHSCADFLSKQSNVTICARDTRSYDILRKNFHNHILLVPDMAFCIDMSKWKKTSHPSCDLFLKRTDDEFKSTPYIERLTTILNMHVTDWPTMLNELDKETRIMHKLKYNLFAKYIMADWYAYKHYRKHLISVGVELLASHKRIYTTRLHTAILGVLMNKEVIFLDNNYGKNVTFFESWLSDCDNVKFVQND